MRNFYSILLTGTLLSCSLHSQNEQDALRYSFTSFGGTARFMSMGGAFGAVGSDISVMSTNPAGIGMYHKNEMTFTPSLYSQNVSSSYNGTTSTDSRYNMRFENFGFVFGGRTQNESATGWQGVGMGIAYNRTNSFQSNMYMNGDATTSLLDSWKKSAGGTSPSALDPFYEGLAWNAWLLNNTIGDSLHYTDTIPDGDLLHQEKSITMRGGTSEWTFALGGNYSDKIYLGISIGIPQVKFNDDESYIEQEVYDSISDFNYMNFRTYLNTTGKGFNCKAGLIYRPVDFMRIGFSFQSPNILRLADKYSSTMTSTVGSNNYYLESQVGQYNYTIRTPMRMTGSLAFVIGKVAMVSADYELVDYSDAVLKAADYSFATANAAIKDKYTMGSNIHVGGEFRVLPMIFRAGFANYSSPYKPTVNNTAAKRYFTGGLGYRDKEDQFFADLAVVVNTEKSNYYFYDQSLVNPVENKFRSLNIALTIGLRF